MIDQSLAPLPPMGYNTWNAFRTKIDFQQIVDMADVMVSSGMRDAGYEYLVVDDGWQASTRDDKGYLQPHPERFAPGIKALADEVHARGLKFGLYGSPGIRTCAMIYDAYDGTGLGSWGHEQRDIETFAEWGVDYLKYDWCEARFGIDQHLDYPTAFARMSELVASVGRPIVYSISEYGNSNPWEWAPGIAHMWRTTPDIEPSFASIQRIALSQRGLEHHSGPGHWNDPDMLQIGNPGLSLEECRTHLALWAMMAAPLMAGNDLRIMTDEVAELLCTPGLIAIDQDPLGKQGRRIRTEWTHHVWRRELSEGGTAWCVVNPLDEGVVRVEVDGTLVVDGVQTFDLDTTEVTDAVTGERFSGVELAPHASVTLLH